MTTRIRTLPRRSAPGRAPAGSYQRDEGERNQRRALGREVVADAPEGLSRRVIVGQQVERRAGQVDRVVALGEVHALDRLVVQRDGDAGGPGAAARPSILTSVRNVIRRSSQDEWRGGS